MNQQQKKLSKEARIGIAIAFISVLFFTTVLIIRNLEGTVRRPSSSTTSSSVQLSTSSNSTSSSTTSSADPVTDLLEEKMHRPYAVEAEIFRYFYDEETPETNASALVFYGGTTTMSRGVDYVYENEDFIVYAAFSGVVETVELDDPAFGNVVQIKSSDGLIANYQSLSVVNVEMGQVISRGDQIGRAGQSLYGADASVHLHFALIRDNIPINPEKFFQIAVKDIK